MIGQNTCADVIRIASIHDYHKTPASLPDAVLRERASRCTGEPVPDIWEDWSREVQETPTSLMVGGSTAAAPRAVSARL